MVDRRKEDIAREWFKKTFPKMDDLTLAKVPAEVLVIFYKKFSEFEFQCEYLGSENECNHPTARCPIRPNTNRCCRFCFEDCYHCCGKLVKRE